MFENCGTLAELNAARIKASSEGIDLITINNAYNARRQDILTTRKPFVALTPIVVKPREVKDYCGVPVAGRSTVAGCIQLTASGFLY